MKPKANPPISGAVSQALAEFKRRGCTLLLVGAPPDAHVETCGQLLGDAPRRILVRTDGTASVAERKLDGDVRVIDRPATIRGASAADAPATESLSELSRTISSAIASAAAGAPEEPGSVRLCLDSIRPYVDATPTPQLRSFLSDLRDTARRHGTVVHVHLPAAPHTIPDPLSESVDAVVEVTVREGGHYQRWHLPEGDVTTDWIGF